MVSSTSETTPKRASGPGTRIRTGVRCGSVSPRYSPASSTVPSCQGSVSALGPQLGAEVALAVGLDLDGRVADGDPERYAGQLVGHELAQAAAQRRARRPRPPWPAVGGGLSSTRPRTTTPSGPPWPR